MKNITVPIVEETKIRIEWVPPVLDDEGNIKKLSDAEKAELKGADKLWGYTGDLVEDRPFFKARHSTEHRGEVAA